MATLPAGLEGREERIQPEQTPAARAEEKLLGPPVSWGRELGLKISHQ